MVRESFVLCESLFKIYKLGELEVVALQGLDLEVAQGEMMALVGPSGAGKSTLLNVVGGLDTPSAGGVRVAGWDLLRMKDRERVEYKRRAVGFVWQQPARNLLPYLSARENIELPMQHNGVEAAVRKTRALELLDAVGLADRADFRPDRLSGGEQQRVAVAVALANNPPLLLGDELTGQVDSESAMQVLDALRAINQAYGTAVIIVTHDPLVASRVDRVVTMRDGRASTEIRRHRSKGERGGTRHQADKEHPPVTAPSNVHEEEWVILDRVGRLQLPRTYVNTLEMRERVRLHLEPDHVSVWAQQPDQQRPGAEAGALDDPSTPLPSTPLRTGRTGPSAGSGELGQQAPAAHLWSATGGQSFDSASFDTAQDRPFDSAQDELFDRLRKGKSDAGVSITVEDLTRTFELAGEEVHALRHVCLEVPAGSLSAIKGPSGSGKTTFLNLIAGLDEPTAGAVRFGGRLLAGMSPEEKVELRRRQIGYVFQTFGLMPFLTVEENVQVPLRLLCTSRHERRVLVDEVLETVGLASRARHRTYELSGGEQQRVAIARALVKGPALILADEPTGQLDSLTGASIITLLREIATQASVTVVVASHDPNIHEAADWIFELRDGELVGTVDQMA